ncbi:hypothetical protein CHUAL_011670 [Chamberlinius hualienensis]
MESSLTMDKKLVIVSIWCLLMSSYDCSCPSKITAELTDYQLPHHTHPMPHEYHMPPPPPSLAAPYGYYAKPSTSPAVFYHHSTGDYYEYSRGHAYPHVDVYPYDFYIDYGYQGIGYGTLGYG